MSDLYKQRGWSEFRSTGMLWLANRILHVFGWVLVITEEESTGEVVNVFPARTAIRGFEYSTEEEGFLKITKYMANNGATLLDEIDDDEPLDPVP